jgi:NADP-dependent 3-hydroxy acid dehydrogenase YdfG
VPQQSSRPDPAPTRGVAVISGGGSGLGREIALALARRGHPLALLGRRLEALEATAREAGGEAVAIPCDVRDAVEVERMAAMVRERWGAAEIVVPAAGVAAIANLEETSPATFRDVIETNLTGVFLLFRALLPDMRRRDRGWLIALLSMAATRGFAGWGAYGASKWGVRGLIAALREELRGSGVRLTAIYPGATDTPLWQDLPGDWERSKMIPAAEVARAVLAALEVDPRATIEEIHLSPAGGAL